MTAKQQHMNTDIQLYSDRPLVSGRLTQLLAMAEPAPPTLPDLNSGPRSFITTDQDHGGIALVVCTLMATWVVLCFFVRLYMRATVSGPFGADDVVCSVSTVRLRHLLAIWRHIANEC